MRETAPPELLPLPASETPASGAPSDDVPAGDAAPRSSVPQRARGRGLVYWLRIGILYALAFAGLALAVGPIGPSVNQDLAAAATARATYRYDRALAWYTAAAARAPDDPRPQCLAGDVYMLQREWQSASGAYRACTQASPRDPNAWLKLGDALNAAGDLSGARGAWQQAESVGSVTAHRRLALLDERQQRFPEALREWALLPPSDPQALAHLGLLALWRGDYDTARTDFIAARAIPNQYAEQVVDGGFVLFAAQPQAGPRALGQLGYLYIRAGMPSFALAPLRQAIADEPEFGDAHAYLGWALWQLGDTAAARPEIAAGLKNAPYLSFAYFAATEVALADGKSERALALAQQALTHDARNAVLWSLDGHLELSAHQYALAEIALDNAAQLSNDPAYTIDALRVYVAHGLGLATGRAHAATISALQRFPENSEITDLVSAVDSELGYATVAYYTAVQAQALDPTNPEPYVLLARYSLNQEDYVAAALDLRTALALQPNGPEAAEAAALLAPLAAAGS